MVKNTGIIKRKVFDDYTKKLYGVFVANNASRGNRTPGLTLEGLNVTTTSLTHRFYLHIFRINYTSEDLKPHPKGVLVSNRYWYLTPKN